VKEVSGQTSIPVLVDGDVVLDDDDDIIPYLEEKYGKATAKV
jgi:glutathione S-transferase